MREELREFLATLEKAYSRHVNYLNAQLASFEYPFTTFKYPEDVIQFLYELTLHLEEPRYYASGEWRSHLGLGVGVVGERFERIFGKDVPYAYSRAFTSVDSGIRGVVEQYFEGYLEESARKVLIPIIHTFFEVEYGWFPDFDYVKSHSDGKDYFEAYKDRLPVDIVEKARKYMFGTKIEKSGEKYSILYEVYVMYPQLVSV